MELQAVIKYGQMMHDMGRIDHAGRARTFDLEFVYCSRTKKDLPTNGKLGHKKGVCLLSMQKKINRTVRLDGRKPKVKMPDNWRHKLLQLYQPETGEITRVYSRLILKFNGLTVID